MGTQNPQNHEKTKTRAQKNIEIGLQKKSSTPTACRLVTKINANRWFCFGLRETKVAWEMPRPESRK